MGHFSCLCRPCAHFRPFDRASSWARLARRCPYIVDPVYRRRGLRVDGCSGSLSSRQDRIEAFVRASAFEAAIGIVIVALASLYGPAAAAAAVVARTLALLPLRTTAALTPEGIAPARLVRAIASPLLAAAGMSVPVALWRIAALGRVSDAIFVASAIVIGVATVGVFLFGLYARRVARLRTFLHASAERPPADSKS